MTQKDFEIEDTVICLDSSRSMARRDFKPTRLEAVKEALATFIRQKYDIDKNDRFALVTFSTNAKIVQELTNEPEKIINAIKGVTPQGISSLGEGLAIALHVVADQILKQGANVNRVLVISDGKPWLGTVDPLEKSQIMGEVGVLVDTIELSAKRMTAGQNILESVAILGEYFQVSDTNYLTLTMKSLSHKKDVYELKKTIPKLHLIAESLLNPNELREEIVDAIKEIKKEEEEKCAICRTNDCKVCGTTTCGRLCPYCKTFLHLCCAIKWAEESKMAEASVFRCPHCLFLLRLPEEVTGPKVATAESQKEDELEVKIPEGKEKVGDFVQEHGQVKLLIKLSGQDKALYLSWENWGSRDFNCNIMSGMNEIECKEFSPKINWTDRSCAGFVIRDHTGWFSKPNIDQGIFLLDLVQFENWCKIVLKDVEYIKGLMAKFPEIKLQSDKLIDFEFIIDVNYKLPIDTTNRNKLDQRLLEDAVRYLQFLKNRPYFKFSLDQRLEIPKTPIETSLLLGAIESVKNVPPIEKSTSSPAILPTEPVILLPNPPQETPPVSIENPYDGQQVEIPIAPSEEKYIGTAKTLIVPKAPKERKTIPKMPKIEIPAQPVGAVSKKEASLIQKPPEKIKLRCSSCQKWFEVEKFEPFPCPTCSQPLKLAIQCDQCNNWFSVSKPGKYNCPKCKAPIDASTY